MEYTNAISMPNAGIKLVAILVTVPRDYSVETKIQFLLFIVMVTLVIT